MYTRKLCKNGEIIDSDSHILDGKPYKTWAKNTLYTGTILFNDTVNKMRVSSSFKEGKLHRVDGPALKAIFRNKRRSSGTYTEWWIENKKYKQINLSDYLVLDYSEGEYGLMWVKLLDKDQTLDYPDIPGLITK